MAERDAYERGRETVKDREAGLIIKTQPQSL